MEIPENHDRLEQGECIVWMRILARRKAQGLNFHTHKDLYQHLSRLLQNTNCLSSQYHAVNWLLFIFESIHSSEYATYDAIAINPAIIKPVCFAICDAQ